MDKALAQYLFANETLYFDNTEKKTIADDLVEAKLPEIIQTPAVQNIAETLEPDFFEMKTHHLIVVNNISEENRAFLVKILIALNLNLTKVDLLDMVAYKGAGFKEIIYNNTVNTILFFGEKAGGEFLEKLKLSNYQPKEIKQIQFLKSDDLDSVEANQENQKKQLWTAVKQLYQI